MSNTKPVTIPHGMKWCPACGECHAETEFYSDRSRPDGLARLCRKADNKRRVERKRVLAAAREVARVDRIVAWRKANPDALYVPRSMAL
ncbi:hypothetical protein [Paraburkholderia tropica]|uniref:hypothetical protein n=1 Tax=Paraburkholderia tropica TaxID=92647 RepID=UPI003D26BD1E